MQASQILLCDANFTHGALTLLSGHWAITILPKVTNQAPEPSQGAQSLLAIWPAAQAKRHDSKFNRQS